MGVDYTIGIGYGYRLREEDILNPDPDNLSVSEILETLYTKYPRLTYITGGSYYDSTPIEHAIVFRSTHQDMRDFAGFLEFQKPKITVEDHVQIRQAMKDLTGKDFYFDAGPTGLDRLLSDTSLSWHVAGLWH